MASAPAALVAAVADRYAIERELGSGATATVYLAQDLKHARRVAIKVLRPELAAALGPERFLREITIAAQLSHPHILPLFDSGEAAGFLYYVMPFAEGETLGDRLAREQRIPLADAVRYADQVAAALGHAHAHGIVHRDIKPENILLVGDQAVVADFGIARAVEAAGGESITRTGIAVGTPAYMSPEQAYGGTVDGRADIYALGCVTFEMIAGRPPFIGPTPMAVIGQHAADAAPSVSITGADVPIHVERAVARALAKDPAERFASPEEFAKALTSGIVVAIVGQGRARQRTWQVAAAAVLLVAALGIVTTLSAARIERLAVLPLTDLTGDSTQAHLVQGVHEALIAELAQLGLPVIARTTMARYRGTDKSLGEIARELDVHGVIEGSFFRKGDSIEIAARLYDAREREVWSGTYTGDLPNVIAMYRGFARAIADEIRLSLSPAAEARLAAQPAVNPRVYEAYLRGMHILSRSTPVSDLSQALGYFEAAIEENPADAMAYAGLADAHVTLGHGPAPPPGTWERARAAAERALRLDSTLAQAWSSLAQVRYYAAWDWAGADTAFRRANALNPSIPFNHYHYSWYLATVGRLEEAIREHDIAARLDPLTPLFTVWKPGLPWVMRDFERSLREAQAMAEQYPNHPVSLFLIGSSAAELGQFALAIPAHEQLVAMDPRWRFALGLTYAMAGRRTDAERIAAELEAEPANTWNAMGLSIIHAELGNAADAYRWLEYEPRHGWWAGFLDLPAYDAIRDQPRFQRLVRMVGLPTAG